MWRYKASISANKNPKNLQVCIKISLDQISQSTSNRNIPIYKTGAWTYTITVCTRRHSSTSLTELYRHTWRISETNNGRSLCRWFKHWRRQNNRCTNSKRHHYISTQRSKICLKQVALKFPWTRRKQSRIKFNWTNLCETTIVCQNWRDKNVRNQVG